MITLQKIEFNFNPKKEVVEPFTKGYYAESFARLDAYLDAWVDALMLKSFNVTCDSILLNALNELELLTPFEKARILDRKGFLPKGVYARIKAFKEVRNKLAHSLAPLAEHGLKLPSAQGKKQEQVEQMAEAAIAKAMEDGLKLYGELAALAQAK